jgi:peptide/nickel transport system permease protein
MGRYVVRRLLAFIPTMLVVSVLVFLMVDLVPGDPVALMLGLEASGEAINARRLELGLHRPLIERMVSWFANAGRGNLGDSYFLHESVTRALAERIPITFSLASLALAVAIMAGMSAGIVASVKQGTTADWGVMLLALFGLSVPSFWLALNLIFLFAVRWQWFPVGGYVAFTDDPGSFLKHIFLPGFSLGLVHAAVIARMTRARMLEVLRMDYIRTARAKGLSEWVVVYGHAIKNALIPIVTVIGISAGVLLGGAVVTETVFNLPGVGRLVVEGVKRRDYPIIQGGILFLTCTYMFSNLVVDLLYAWINPRIRYE